MVGSQWGCLLSLLPQLTPFSSPGGLIESCLDPHSLLPHLEGPGSKQGRQGQDSLSPSTAPKLKAVSVAQPGRNRPRGKWERKERQMGQSLLVTAHSGGPSGLCSGDLWLGSSPERTCYLENLPRFIRARDVCLQLPYRQPPTPTPAVGLTIISYSSVDRY